MSKTIQYIPGGSYVAKTIILKNPLHYPYQCLPMYTIGTQIEKINFNVIIVIFYYELDLEMIYLT